MAVPGARRSHQTKRPQSRIRRPILSGRNLPAEPALAEEAVRTNDPISAERNFAEVCLFAYSPAEFAAPPTIGHHSETSSTMIADLWSVHHALGQQHSGISFR